MKRLTWLAALTTMVLAGSPPDAGAASLEGWRRGVNLEGWLGAAPFVPLGDVQLGQLKAVRAAGFDFVRIPVDPALFIGARAGSAEPQASLNRLLREAAARGLGVDVVLAPQPGLRQQVLRGGLARDTYLALIERLAQQLSAARMPRTMLEPLAEPVDPNRSDCGPSSFDWPSVLSAFVGAARRGAPTLPVLVTGICYADAGSLTELRPLRDKNVVYGFQYLDPLKFTQQGNPTDDHWKTLKGVRYTPADTAAMQATFAALGGWARQHGVPVMLTSFAVHNSAPQPDRLRWFADVRQQAESQRLTWAVWSWQSPYGFGLSRSGKLQDGLKRVLGL
ncbi:glycoside hydrolase family 5 protein [Deinococcus oregonensis]|uniref:Glycoside hydrolase family 5 protein n=1 Tax=Deinococcus oregonensis TaxID=1805970 RepID=A0ABV6ATX7_9DEIO